jgi:hypothetical protein
MVNDRAAIGLLALYAHNIMKPRVNEQETFGALAVCNDHHEICYAARLPGQVGLPHLW